MKVTLKYILTKLILSILAIQTLNTSVDAIDFHPLYAVSNNFNEINSAVEFISEIVLGYENAFPEIQTQKEKKNTQSVRQHTVIKIYEPKQFFYTIEQRLNTIVSFSYPLDEKYSYLFSKNITPPPPKFA